MAHKLARLIYHILKTGTSDQDAGEHYDEQKYKVHLLARLQKQAALFGFSLRPQQRKEATVS